MSNCSFTCVFTDTLIFPRASSRIIWPLNDSTAAGIHFIAGACKAREVIWDTIHFDHVVATPARILVPVESVNAAKKTRFIHGDISYNFSNHSSPDTSFVGNSFVQHQVTVNLFATISKKYPVIFHFSTLQTSIPYVHNYVDFSIQFDSRQFKTSMIDQYMSQINSKMTANENRDSIIRSEVIRNFNQQQDLSKWLTGDKQIQQLMYSRNTIEQYAGHNNRSVLENLAENEAKHELSGKDSAVLKAVSDLEKIKNETNSANLQQALRSKLSAKGKDSTGTLSLQELTKAEKFIGEYSKKLNAYRNAGQRKDSLAVLYDSLRRYTRREKDSLEKMIRDGKTVELAKEYGDSLKNKPVMKFLMGIQKLALGNSFIDYSQLSVRNINVLGFNMEWCNHYYFALTAGTTDFRYMDFLSVTPIARQYLVVGRIGIGEKMGEHLYLTAFTGKKQTSYYVNNKPSAALITGLTLETRIPINKNIFITGEIGKSTAPGYIPPTPSAGNKLFKFSDHDNEAYSLQLNAFIPETDTRFTGVYNRLGINYQSFSIYNSNATSDSWELRLDQSLLQKKLFLSASARKNDLSSPLTVNSYKSQSLFYSFQASLRLKKWPVITVGFLPYSQITDLNGELTISRFYTLMGSSTYAYRVKKLFMMSSVVYTHYFNSSNQAGFALYDAQSWFMNQSVLLKKFTLSGTGTISYSPHYFLFSAGPGLQWHISKSLDLGAGVKYNDFNHTEKTLGYNGNMDLQIGKLGRIGLSYEKGFIPGMNNGFYRNDWGKATYSKNF